MGNLFFDEKPRLKWLGARVKIMPHKDNDGTTRHVLGKTGTVIRLDKTLSYPIIVAIDDPPPEFLGLLSGAYYREKSYLFCEDELEVLAEGTANG